MADNPPGDWQPGEQPPAAPRRLAGPLWLLRHILVYFALLAGTALVLGGASLAAQAVGFDLDASRFGRLLIVAVYVIGAVAALVRLGG